LPQDYKTNILAQIQDYEKKNMEMSMEFDAQETQYNELKKDILPEFTVKKEELSPKSDKKGLR
jgi:hypothetical protein